MDDDGALLSVWFAVNATCRMALPLSIALTFYISSGMVAFMAGVAASSALLVSFLITLTMYDAHIFGGD